MDIIVHILGGITLLQCGGVSTQKSESAGKVDNVFEWDPYVHECENVPNCIPNTFTKVKFDPKSDASKLKLALNSSNLETQLIDILMQRNLKNRLDIVKAYNTKNRDRDLLKNLDKKLKNSPFKVLVLGMLKPLTDYYTEELHEILSKKKIHYESLIGILGTLSNRGIRAIAEHYSKMYGESLRKALQIKEFDSENARDVCVSLAMGNRDKGTFVDEQLVKQDIHQLAQEEEHKLDIDLYKHILVHRNFPYILRVHEEYRKETFSDIDEVIAALNPSFKKIVTLLHRIVRNKHELLADRMNESLEEKDFNSFIRIIITRSEIDLRSILDAFRRKQGHSLSTVVQKKLKSLPDNAKKAILTFIGETK